MAIVVRYDPPDNRTLRGAERSVGGGVAIFKYDEVAINQPFPFR